jgi:hypothetical protein
VPAAAWLATVGFGCFAEFLTMGAAAFAWGEPWLCLRYIAEMGVPLTVLTLMMLSYAGPVRPLATMLLAALGMSGLSAAGLAFFHPTHTAWLGLVWHRAALAIVLACGAPGAALLRMLYAPRLARRRASSPRAWSLCAPCYYHSKLVASALARRGAPSLVDGGIDLGVALTRRTTNAFAAAAVSMAADDVADGGS